MGQAWLLVIHTFHSRSTVYSAGLLGKTVARRPLSTSRVWWLSADSVWTVQDWTKSWSLCLPGRFMQSSSDSTIVECHFPSVSVSNEQSLVVKLSRSISFPFSSEISSPYPNWTGSKCRPVVFGKTRNWTRALQARNILHSGDSAMYRPEPLRRRQISLELTIWDT